MTSHEMHIADEYDGPAPGDYPVNVSQAIPEWVTFIHVQVSNNPPWGPYPGDLNQRYGSGVGSDLDEALRAALANAGEGDTRDEPEPEAQLDIRSCRVCGCSEDTACLGPDGPCSWVEADLCSACLGVPS